MRVGTLSGEGVVVVRYMGEVAQARITVPTDRRFNDAVYAGLPRNNFVDDLAYARFQKLGLLPSDLCSDPEFIRRAFIDTIGLLPEPAEVRRFLADESPDKRAKLIDRLLDDPGYAANASQPTSRTTKWCANSSRPGAVRTRLARR